jgi:uncharacterized protein (UPF0254 family)
MPSKHFLRIFCIPVNMLWLFGYRGVSALLGAGVSLGKSAALGRGALLSISDFG